VAQILQFHPELSDDKLSKMVGNVLQQLRTVYKPEKTNKGRNKRNVGDAHGQHSSEQKKYRAANPEYFKAAGVK
jgi:hypothetical protein